MALAALIYVIVIGFGFSSLSLYVVPVSNEFGLTRAQVNGAYAMIGIGNALWAPIIGWAIDRVSLRLVMAVSIAFMSAGIFAIGLSHSVVIDIALMVVCISIGLDGGAQISLNVLVARWFKANRSLAMTLAASGQALGKISVPPMIGLLIENFGWRASLQIGALGLLVIVLLAILLIRERPTTEEFRREEFPEGVNTLSAADTGPPAGMRDLLRMPNFWYLALGNALILSITFTIGVSLVPLALDYNIPLVQATTLGSTYAIASLATKLVVAKIADKVDRFYLTVGLLLFGVPLWPMIYLVHNAAELWIMFIFAGIAVGAFVALFPILQVDTFGLPSFGTVRGLMIPVQSIFQALVAPVAGFIYDTTGTYHLMFLGFSGIELVVAMLVLFTRRTVIASGPKQPLLAQGA